MIDIRQVSGGADLDAVRDLCRAFRRSQFERYADQMERISRYYGEAEYEDTLARLAEIHAPPGGLVLLARVNGRPAGCVMYARDGETVCQMKRMFVDPAFRGTGVGGALGEALIAGAQASGYARMRLDTGPRQTEAVALYLRLGFAHCAAYVEDGPPWPDKVYMDRALDSR